MKLWTMATLSIWLTIHGPALGQQLLINGDFESPPTLGAGQLPVAIGAVSWISTNPVDPSYPVGISGIVGWTYATPLNAGTYSDHGLARRNGSFGLPAIGQSAFINNWNRMMSQTVLAKVGPGDTVTASINFGTLGSPVDTGRAGRFYLVAGEADPLNLDQFSARSIILAQVSVANPTWLPFVPDMVVNNGVFVPLNISYTYLPSDPALGLPITVAFRTVTASVGLTYWDDASLTLKLAPVIPPPVPPVPLPPAGAEGTFAGSNGPQGGNEGAYGFGGRTSRIFRNSPLAVAADPVRNSAPTAVNHQPMMSEPIRIGPGDFMVRNVSHDGKLTINASYVPGGEVGSSMGLTFIAVLGLVMLVVLGRLFVR